MTVFLWEDMGVEQAEGPQLGALLSEASWHLYFPSYLPDYKKKKKCLLFNKCLLVIF